MTMLVTLLALLLKASAVMVAGFVAALVFRRAAAATRHLSWTFVVAALLSLPALTPLLPDQATIPVAPRAAETLTRVTAQWTFEASGSSQTSSEASAPAPADGAARSTPPMAIVPALYAAGVLLLLLRLVVQYFMTWRGVRRAVLVHDDDWMRELRASEALLGVRRRVELRRSLECVMPFVFGIWRPTVVLPATADLWSHDRRRAVLLHELAHAARHDCLTQVLAGAACALYWVHPGVWRLARRQRVEQELACDDRVVAAGEDAVSYAGHLVELARTLPSRPTLAAAMAGAGPVERRVRALLDARRRRRPPARGGQALAIAAVIAGVLPLAALDPTAAPRLPLLPIQDAPAATFDVVSVKPNNSVGTGGQISRRDGKGGLSIVNQTLRALIQFAYQLQPSQLVDAPDWIDRERFDIEARTSLKLPVPRLGETSPESLMLRAVLEDRFNLRARREARPLEVFALVVARADRRLGPNLRRPTNDFCERRFQAYKSGETLPNPAGQVCGISGSNDQLTAGSFALSSFANFLSGQVRRIVIDRTNLDGVWDFTLKWTPNDAQQTDPDRPSIFTALEEQLGLKLEATTAPVDVLVVERVDRPTPD